MATSASDPKDLIKQAATAARDLIPDLEADVRAKQFALAAAQQKLAQYQQVASLLPSEGTTYGLAFSGTSSAPVSHNAVVTTAVSSGTGGTIVRTVSGS